MGFTRTFVTGVMNRIGTLVQTEYEVWRFMHDTVAHISWCGPQRKPPEAGESDVAAGTLRVKLPPEDQTEDHIAYSGFEFPATDQGVYEYSEILRYHEDVYSALMHLALPPHHLPQISSVKPRPDYGWRHEERFVLIWTQIATERVEFKFQAVSTEDFSEQAALLSKRIRELPASTVPALTVENRGPTVRVSPPLELVARLGPDRRYGCGFEVAYGIENVSRDARLTVDIESEIDHTAVDLQPKYSQIFLNPEASQRVVHRFELTRGHLRSLVERERVELQSRAWFSCRRERRLCCQESSVLPSVVGFEENWWRNGVVAILALGDPAKGDRRKKGAGFLIDQARIVTCAHVVRNVLGTSPVAGAEIDVRFEASASIARAIVSEHRCGTVEDDVVILLLRDQPPAGAQVLPLADSPAFPGSQIVSLGYPSVGKLEHIVGRGEVADYIWENDHPRLQVRSSEITGGFSGAPLWHVNSERVIGMVQQGLKPDPDGRLGNVAIGVPADTLREALERG